jgi:hypothetical protein
MFAYFTVISWEHWLMGFMHPVLIVLEKKRVEDQERAADRAKSEQESRKKEEEEKLLKEKEKVYEDAAKAMIVAEA